MQTTDEIWQGDRLGRRAEAEQVIGYLESVAMRPSLRDDGHAFVLAIDSPYGEGKTFFLSRLAKHMAQHHPVAFVDAWQDDLEDEPMVALAATLDQALSQYADDTPDFREKVAAFKAKAGAVAKIVGIGLLKRASSFVIMQSGAEAVHEVLAKPADLTKDLGKDVLKKAADNIVDEVTEGLAIVSGPMQERIDRFRAGQRAIEEMKAALRSIIEHLATEKVYPPPVVIIVDELDRCRPTYAIKVLEEIKHLFDVEGVVFVLGTHGDALAHSVAAAYGSAFDGRAYLRRFFSRTYQLKAASLQPLVSWLFDQRNIPSDRLEFPSLSLTKNSVDQSTAATVTALYMEMYGFNARDAFAVVDGLETSLALTGALGLFLPLLVPMLLAHLRNHPGLLEPVKKVGWQFMSYGRFGERGSLVDPHMFAITLLELARLDANSLMERSNQQQDDYATGLVARMTFNGQSSRERIDRPMDYGRLLNIVDRFKS